MEKLALIINTNIGSSINAMKIAKVIQELGHNTEIVQGYDYIDPKDHDPTHIFLSAVPADVDYSLTERKTREFISQKYDWLRYIDVPVMGICFGHQIIAHMYGGDIREMKKERLSRAYNITVKDMIEDSGIFEGIETIAGFVAHQDYVIPPTGFIELASARRVCYAMKHHEKDIYGLQFHPELSGEVGKELIRRFMELPATNTGN